MKVAIIGANGKTGVNLVKEALKQGYDVTAIVRNKEYKNSDVKVVYKDIFELTKADLAGFDAVISAFGAFADATFPLYKKAVVHLANLLSGSSTRLVIVGGCGVVFRAKRQNRCALDLRLACWRLRRRWCSHRQIHPRQR